MRAFHDSTAAGGAPLCGRPGAGATASWASKLFRCPADARLVEASLIYLAVVCLAPSAWIIAPGVWWISNTVSHNFIHRPFFRSRGLNLCFAFYLTAITGIPQRLWRERHLAHHVEVNWRFRLSRELAQQALLLAVLWCIALSSSPEFAISTLVPGLAGALALCWLQGHFEHGRGTTSHYGKLYNALFFNDGLHVEHHRAPKIHWSELSRAEHAKRSAWPAVLRWLEWFSLSGLERGAAKSSLARAWVVRVHERALRRLWGESPGPARIAVVGGGLFPRSALVARSLWPEARLVIYDCNREHLQEARGWLTETEELVERRITAPEQCVADLVIVPLALDLAKAPFYARANGQRVLVHDWIWRGATGRTEIVSWFLLKRMNLVEG